MNEWTVAIGVDTHKRAHVAAALDRFGNELELLEIEAGERGYERLWRWATAFGVCVFAIEGAGSYRGRVGAFPGRSAGARARVRATAAA